MNWEKLKIKDFANVVTGGTPSTSKSEYWNGGDIPWLNSGELNQGCIMSSSNFITKEGLKNSAAKIMPPDTVLIALTGATTGVTAYLNIQACANQSVTGILPSKRHHPKFLYYYLGSIRSKILHDSYGGAQKHISQGYVKEIQIPLPPLSIQIKIAAILDKADNLRKKDQQLFAKYDELLQCVFYEMFGDPVKNEKDWEICSLINFGSFKNGLNYSRNDSGISLKCLGVSDFKDFSELRNIESLSNIDLSSTPSEDYFLKNGDLVFVRSNGNKNLVARCLVVYPQNNKVTFSGFCIRYRPANKSINTIYLSHLFRIPVFRKMMLQNGRGANIQNINQKLLEDLKIPMPPYELQNQFASIVQNIQQQKYQIRQQMTQGETLFQSLLHRAFKGELIVH